MDITITPTRLHGTISAIPSKSQVHRLLILSAFADGHTKLFCSRVSQDMLATMDCLNALGAAISVSDDGFFVHPANSLPSSATLNCRESGSTLRFLLPVAAALGLDTTFQMEGRLSSRPLSPLWEELERHGCTLAWLDDHTLHLAGGLNPGDYQIAANVSSQFISGLLFAMALIPGHSQLSLTGQVTSLPYIHMTLDAMKQFGIDASGYAIHQDPPFRSPGTVFAEGDWSNGAFWKAAAAIGNAVTVTGLNEKSLQGDRRISQILEQIHTCPTIDATHIPDLVPILSVVAAAKSGATFTGISRLRLKESDRVDSVCNMICALGAKAIATENTLRVLPGEFHECTIDSYADHRIAMSAAIASTISTGPVTIQGAQCVAKSYPEFWEDYEHLGGNYVQYLR